MRRLPAILLSLVLVIGLLLVLSYTVFKDRDAAGSQASAQPGAGAASEAPASGADADLARPDEDDVSAQDQGEALVGVEVTEERSAAATEAFDPARVVRVAGRVVVPAGTPADESIEILVLDRERPASSTSSTEEGEALVLSSGQLVEADHVLERVEVSATGAFELELSPDVAEAWLHVGGRYVYARKPVRVTRDAPQLDLELDTRLGAWVRGRLVLPEGAELGDIDLEETLARLQPDERRGMGQAGMGMPSEVRRHEGGLNAELEFAWGGVAADVAYDVRVRPDAFAAHKSELFDLHPGESIQLDVPLTRGGRVSGLALDEEGAPLAGVKLELEIDPLMMGMGGYEVREGESDADGRFELTAVTPGKLVLRAEKDGYLDASTDVEVLEGGSTSGVELTVSRGASISGTLRWPDGTPVADTEVDATFDLSNLGGMGAFNAMVGPRGEGDTDAEGAFVVSGLGRGPFTVTAEAEQDGRTWRARQDGVAPDTEGLELVLEPPVDLSGRVVDEAGEPVREFRVRARTRTKGMIEGLGARTVSDLFEDEEGRFNLEGLSKETWIVSAGGEGYGDGTPQELSLPLTDPEQEIVLVLPHAATVEGVVLDPDGRPVAGATVREQATLQGISARVEGREQLEATSDELGRYSLEGLTAGVRALEAVREGYAKSEPVSVDVAPSQVVSDVTITLRVGGRIVGEIFGSDGKLKSGATILAQSPADLSNQRFSSSDGEGRFEFDNVAPGSWQVMTMPNRGGGEGVSEENFAEFFSEMKLQMVEVADGEEVFVQLGAPPADPVEVTGTVLLDGSPQSGVMISFILDSEEAGQPQFKFTTSDKAGGYRLQLDQPGKYLVQVQKLVGVAGQQQNIQLNTEVPEEPEFRYDVDLPVGAIAGLVRGPDGKPSAGTRVTLMADGPVSNLSFFGGNYAEIETDADGRYELVWLREGTYSVSAGGPLMGGLFGGGDEDSPGRVVQSGIEVKDGQRTEGVDFRLQAPGKLTGVVRDDAGKPVAAAGIFLRDSSGELVERISLVATDGGGAFKYSSLAPGRYTVTARDQARVSASEAVVTIRSGEETRAELNLSPGTMLKVLLSDREGNPVDCEVLVTDEEGRQVNGNWTFAELMAWSSSGSFSSKEQSVGPLPAGKYRVEASSSDGKQASKNVNLSGQDVRKLRLRLRD